MGWNLTAALIVIAVASAAGGLLVSAIARQKKRRVRGPFLVGVVCGFMVGVALAGRRRGLNAVGASRMYAVNRQLRAWFGLATEGCGPRAHRRGRCQVRNVRHPVRHPVRFGDLAPVDLAPVSPLTPTADG